MKHASLCHFNFFKFLYIYVFSLELIKVYDGIASFRHHNYKLISVPRHTSVEQLVAAAMWAFHLTGDPGI